MRHTEYLSKTSTFNTEFYRKLRKILETSTKLSKSDGLTVLTYTDSIHITIGSLTLIKLHTNSKDDLDIEVQVWPTLADTSHTREETETILKDIYYTALDINDFDAVEDTLVHILRLPMIPSENNLAWIMINATVFTRHMGKTIGHLDKHGWHLLTKTAEEMAFQVAEVIYRMAEALATAEEAISAIGMA